MADINVTKVDYTVSVDKATNTVTVNTTPTTVVVNSEAYAPVTSVNDKTGAVVLSTTDINEGTNLYWTDGRFTSGFDTRLATKTTTDLTEGNNLYWTDTRFDNRLASKSINALNDVDTATTPPTNGKALVWNGTTSQWTPQDPVAVSASAVNIFFNETENHNHYVTFVRNIGDTTAQVHYNDTQLTWNPNTNTLGSGGIYVNGTANVANYVDIIQQGNIGEELDVLFASSTKVAYDQFDGITYNPNAKRLTVTNLTVTNPISGTISSATNAGFATTAGQSNNVAVTVSDADATHYPVFASATTGYIGPRVDSQLTYNPGTNTLTANTFVGNLTGTASQATNATNVGVTNTSVNTTYYPMFASATTGNVGPGVNTFLTYNPSTGNLNSTTFTGQLVGNASTATTATNANNVAITTTTPGTTYYVPFVSATTGNRALNANYSSLRIEGATDEFIVGHKVVSEDGFSGSGYQATNGGGLSLYESNANGTNSITVRAAASMAADYTVRLPASQGSANTALLNDGSGNLSWSALDGRNLTYSGSTLNLDTALTDVNSVTAATATDFTVTGDRLVIKTRDVGGVADTFLTLDADGYRFSGSSTPAGALNGSATDAYVTSAGTTSEQFYAYSWAGTLIAGSNQITNCRVYGWDDVGLATALDWNTNSSLVLDKPIHIAGNNYVNLQLGVKVGSIAIDPGNSTIATITMATSDGATTAVAQSGATITNTGIFAHYMRNSASTGVALLGNWQSVQGTGTFTPGSPIVITFTRLLTGLLAFQAVDYWSHTYTVAPTGFFSGRRILTLQTTNATNEHVNVPFALGVGPGAVSTNRGLPSDSADAIGINLYNPGTIRGYTGRTIFNLTQTTDNSFYTGSSTTAGSTNPIEKAGGQFQFNHVRGNANTAIGSIYARNGDGLGGLTWWSNSGTNITSLVSSTHTPAGIYALATEDQTGSTTGTVGQNSGANANASGKHGAGVFMQYTPNASGVSRPRTFLAANDKTLELRSVDTVVLKPVIKTSSNTTDRALAAPVNHTWLTASDYVLGNAASGTNSMAYGTGAKVTVGITSASGNNGDVGLVLQRATGNTANFELKLPTGSANTLQLINNATSTTIATVTDSAIALNANTRVTGGLRTYGEFAYTAGQITPSAADTILAFPLDTTNTASGITISNTSRVNINRSGFYKLIMSLQVKNLDNATDHLLRFWLRKNGADVANSSTVITPLKLQEQVIAMDWLVESDGDDYFEIVYYVNDVDVVFPYYAALTTPVVAPVAPPIILNVIPIGV